MVDEDIGSCLLRVVTYPMDWSGSLDDYETFVGAAWLQFLAQSGVLACQDNFLLDIRRDNIPVPICHDKECGISEIQRSVGDLLTNDELANWDAIAAFTNKDICGSTAGCRNGKSIWIEVDEHGDPPFQFEFAIKDSVFSHELGHILGFADQYSVLKRHGQVPAHRRQNAVQPELILKSTVRCPWM